MTSRSQTSSSGSAAVGGSPNSAARSEGCGFRSSGRPGMMTIGRSATGTRSSHNSASASGSSSRSSQFTPVRFSEKAWSRALHRSS
ncbi:hypothetical protein ACFQ9X_27910 [Catenulispora yoronensis]